jgi:8-amino-3,8-dideoxy-alpha-D-manno-octulosonate transaminase
MRTVNPPVLAIDGATPCRTRPEPLMFPGGLEIGDAELEAIRQALSQEAFEAYEHTLTYPAVARFERAFAERVGATHALGVSSGTAALIVALAALGIGPGDEVIVPAYTFVATPSAVVAIGAVPIFADVDDSLTLDPDSVASSITPNTRAVIPVHMRGMPADLARLGPLAEDHGIALVEDAAQACGGSFRGRPLGSWGDLGCFSLQSRKIITVGEGGVVVTDDDELLFRARCYHDSASHWRRRCTGGDEPTPSEDFCGLNLRMSPVAGAIGEVQLGRLNGLLDRMRDWKGRLSAAVEEAGGDRVQLQRRTDEGEAGIALIFFVRSVERAHSVARALVAEGVRAKVLWTEGEDDWHVYASWRDLLAQRTWTSTGFPFSAARRPIHYDPTDCSATMDCVSRAVHLDIAPQLSEQDVDETAEALRRVVDALA